MTRPLIEVSGLCVAYGDHVVLNDVSLTVTDGEFVAIVGKSGCGKSTLLHALAGFIDHQGTARVHGEVGVVFQNYAVFPWLTVRENVAFGLSKLPSPERDKVVARHLELIGLTNHAHKYPAQLSGGQTQRVALARALAPRPKVIFMDEPFGALDTFTRARMQEWLIGLSATELRTVLFVTHNIEEAIFIADRVIMMGEGGILDEVQVRFGRPRAAEIRFTGEFIDIHRAILSAIEH